MKVGILGTGMVGRAIGARLLELGHDAMIGDRDSWPALITPSF